MYFHGPPMMDLHEKTGVARANVPIWTADLSPRCLGISRKATLPLWYIGFRENLQRKNAVILTRKHGRGTHTHTFHHSKRESGGFSSFPREYGGFSSFPMFCFNQFWDVPSPTELSHWSKVEPATLGALGRTSRPAAASGGGAVGQLGGVHHVVHRCFYGGVPQ